MKRWLKRLAVTSLIAATALSLTACGQKQSSGSGKKVTIEYFNQKKEMSATLKEIIKDFEKKNPNIHVKETDVPDAGIVLKTRMLSGDVPDVINIFPQNLDFQTWAKAGYFVDMTHKAYIQNIKNHYASKFAVNGKIYNAPLSANVYGFYYNETAFKHLGLKVPQDWSQLENIVKKIQSKGKTPFAIAGSEPWTLTGYHELALASVAGGFNQGNDLVRYSAPNGIKLSNKYIQMDLNRLDILRGTAQKNWQGASYNDQITTFTSGKALMMPQGSWAAPLINAQKPKFKVRTFAFPGPKKGDDMTIGSGDLALSISSKSKHKEAAEKFVAYMSTPAAMQKYYDTDGSPCTIKGVKQAGANSELGGITKYAFTKKHIVFLAQKWTTENDFNTATSNYLMTGNKQEWINAMNTAFNPMKATNK